MSNFGSLSSQRKRDFRPPPPQAPDNPYRKPPPKKTSNYTIGGESYSCEYQPTQSPLQPVKTMQDLTVEHTNNKVVKEAMRVAGIIS